MVFIFRGRYGGPREPRSECCAAAVHDADSRSVGFHQCNFKPVVKREMDGKLYGFCKIHDPVAVKKKSDDRSARWDREWAEKEAREEHRQKVRDAEAACVDAIKKIAGGHNDPRALAARALAMFPQCDPQVTGSEPEE